MSDGTITIDTSLLDGLDEYSITVSNAKFPNTINISDYSYDEYNIRDVVEQQELLSERLNVIEKRLTILTPDAKLLEKYTILQELYEQYKAAEALLHEDEE